MPDADRSAGDGAGTASGRDPRSAPIEGLEPSSVELVGVTKYFGDVEAVHDITLDARAGEFLVLLGPSGCGKSTVLRMVAGLETPSAGTIRIGDRVVNKVVTKDRDVAMVFQSYALYPHLSVRKNIEFPLRSRHVAAHEMAGLVDGVAESLQLSGLLGRKPAELSGGQRQRVAQARALVRRPKVFLMDEPLSNLDAQLRVEMRAELVELHSRLGVTILYVTHDQVEAMTMGKRIAILKDGALQQLDEPAVVHDAPANAFVAGFIGSPPMNILRGPVRPAAGGLAVEVSGGSVPLAPEDTATVRRQDLETLVIGIRPEELRPDPEGCLRATVSLVESVGRDQHITCRFPDGELVIVDVGRSGSGFETGDPVRLVPTGAVHLFDPGTGVRLPVGAA